MLLELTSSLRQLALLVLVRPNRPNAKITSEYCCSRQLISSVSYVEACPYQGYVPRSKKQNPNRSSSPVGTGECVFRAKISLVLEVLARASQARHDSFRRALADIVISSMHPRAGATRLTFCLRSAHSELYQENS